MLKMCQSMFKQFNIFLVGNKGIVLGNNFGDVKSACSGTGERKGSMISTSPVYCPVKSVKSCSTCGCSTTCACSLQKWDFFTVVVGSSVSLEVIKCPPPQREEGSTQVVRTPADNFPWQFYSEAKCYLLLAHIGSRLLSCSLLPLDLFSRFCYHCFEWLPTEKKNVC